MLGRPLLTLHGVDPVRWSKRWGIEPFSHPCSGCGTARTTTVPVAQAKFRGLAAPACPCGEPAGIPCCVVATDGDLFGAMAGRK